MRIAFIILACSCAWTQNPGPSITGAAGGSVTPGTCCTVGPADSIDAFSTNTAQTAGINQAAGGGKFCIATWDGFTGTPTFSNTAGDSWVMLDQWQDGSSFAEFATAYVKSSIGNATDKVTVNLSVTPDQLAVSCLSFTGQNSSAPLDTHVTGNSDGATTVTSSPFSTTGNPNELIIGGLGKYASSPTWTAGNIGGVGATIPSGATSTFKLASIEYLLVTSTQSGITAAASASASGTAMGVGVATFK